MLISFHGYDAKVAELCSDLRLHGAVYWRGARPSFHEVADAMKAQGVPVMLLCARLEKTFVNFTIRADLAGDIHAAETEVAAAILRWQRCGEPLPHLQMLTSRGGFPRRVRPPLVPSWLTTIARPRAVT